MAYSLVVIGLSYSCTAQTTDLQVDPLVAGDTYQWYRNDVLLVGETSSLLGGLAAIGVYKCTVTPLVGPPEDVSQEILPGVQVTEDVAIETEDPEIPLGVCDVNPAPVTLRLVGAAVGGRDYNWSTSETGVEISPDYADSFVLTSVSSTGCQKNSNTIALDTHTNGVNPTGDTNPPGITSINPGQTIELVSDRQVSWYRAETERGAKTFVGRGATLEIGQAGWYSNKDACNQVSAEFGITLNTDPLLKLDFTLELLTPAGKFVKVMVEDVLRDPGRIRTLAILPVETLNIKRAPTELTHLLGYGYELRVNTKTDRSTNTFNAYRTNNVAAKDVIGYVESILP